MSLPFPFTQKILFQYWFSVKLLMTFCVVFYRNKNKMYMLLQNVVIKY